MLSMVIDPSLGTFTIFENGNVLEDVDKSLSGTPTGEFRFLGGGTYNVDSYMYGGGNLRIWNRALSRDEIHRLYKEPWIGLKPIKDSEGNIEKEKSR